MHRPERFINNEWSSDRVVGRGILGTWHVFIAIVTMLMLISCFISNYLTPTFRLLIAVRWLVRRHRPFAKFPRTTHHNAPAFSLSTYHIPGHPPEQALLSILLASILLGWRRTFFRFRTFLFFKEVEHKAANHSGCLSSRSISEVLSVFTRQ
jgi:hypothetical protein